MKKKMTKKKLTVEALKKMAPKLQGETLFSIALDGLNRSQAKKK